MGTSRAMEHHSAQLNGIKQHYVKAGSGPAVMLLHGWPQTCYEWRHVIERLAGNFTVVAPDLRGFGYTSKPASGYDAATIASDLAALTAHLAFKDITVIGHDWGAVFGYVYAASSPNEVSALGVVEMALPGVGVMERAMSPVARGNFLWHMGFQSVPDLPELLIRGKERPYLQWFFEHFAYDLGHRRRRSRRVCRGDHPSRCPAGRARCDQDFFTSAGQVTALAKTPLTIPVRAFGGEACLGALTLTSVQAVAPNAEGGVIERCGHWAAEERPDFVEGIVRELAKTG